METVIVPSALLVGFLVGWLAQRKSIWILRGLLNDSERRSEAHQGQLVQMARHLSKMEEAEAPMHPAKREDDDESRPGCGGGEDQRAQAWNRERADAEYKLDESFAETMIGYGMGDAER